MNEYCDKLKDIKAEEVSGKEENVATWLVSKPVWFSQCCESN